MALTAACSNRPTTARGAGASAAPTVLRVFAASSLTDVFATLVPSFEAAHPGMKVELNFAGSSALREQLLGGAPGDVFASAAPADMDALDNAGLVDRPVVFARNRLEIAVHPARADAVTGIGAFGDASLLLGLSAPSVPCGRLAREALAKAGVAAQVDTEEPDVRSLLTKVESGDLDAGIVYATDVKAAGAAVVGVPLDPSINVTTDYPAAVLAGAGDPTSAAAFVTYLRSSGAKRILAGAGFEIP